MAGETKLVTLGDQENLCPVLILIHVVAALAPQFERGVHDRGLVLIGMAYGTRRKVHPSSFTLRNSRVFHQRLCPSDADSKEKKHQAISRYCFAI
jgi:hypothetical protein